MNPKLLRNTIFYRWSNGHLWLFLCFLRNGLPLVLSMFLSWNSGGSCYSEALDASPSRPFLNFGRYHLFFHWNHSFWEKSEFLDSQSEGKGYYLYWFYDRVMLWLVRRGGWRLLVNWFEDRKLIACWLRFTVIGEKKAWKSELMER